MTRPTGRARPGLLGHLINGGGFADDDGGADLQFRDSFAKADHRISVAEQDRTFRGVRFRHREGVGVDLETESQTLQAKS